MKKDTQSSPPESHLGGARRSREGVNLYLSFNPNTSEQSTWVARFFMHNVYFPNFLIYNCGLILNCFSYLCQYIS